MNDPERKKLINLYSALGVAIALSVVPNTIATIVSLIFFTGVLTTAKRIRKNTEEHSLSDNHCIYIIRTFWITILISIITFSSSGIYLYTKTSYDAFSSCSDTLMNAGAIAGSNVSAQKIYQYAEPCMDQFFSDNFNAFLVAIIIGVIPALGYLGYRYIKGLSRAIKGYRIANPKGWL